MRPPPSAARPASRPARGASCALPLRARARRARAAAGAHWAAPARSRGRRRARGRSSAAPRGGLLASAAGAGSRGARAGRRGGHGSRCALALARGVPLQFLGPRGWDELAGGIAAAHGAARASTCPTAALDEWTRIVIVARRRAADRPRRCSRSGRAARRSALPGRRSSLLATLYAVPVVEHEPRRAVPAAGPCSRCCSRRFLWLERCGARDAGRGAGARRWRGARRLARGARARRRPPAGWTTRRSPQSLSPRRHAAIAGTTPTARWTGRATAARCCASRRRRARTGRPQNSTTSTACAGSQVAARRAPTGDRGDRPSLRPRDWYAARSR